MKKKDFIWKAEESKKIIKAALDKWGENIGIAFTGRKDSSVMVHLIKQVSQKPITAMFIDHGLHFKESYNHLEKIIKMWNLDVKYVADQKLLKKLTAERDKKKRAKILRELKIKTIAETIKANRWKALFVAIRWDEHPARASEEYFSKRKNHWRIHPILHFTEKDIWAYTKEFKIPYNPLYDQGYRSLGEKEFTKVSRDKNAPERAGREKEKEEVMERLRILGYF